MTISNSNNKSGPYSGNGSTTVFARKFRVLDADHLKVYQTVSGITAEVTTGITKDGIGDDSGNVTFDVAPASGTEITLLREVPLTQETDYSAQGKVSPEQVEDDFDMQEMQIQDMNEQVSRSLKLPINGSGVEVEVASGQYIRRKVDGSGFEGVDPQPSVVVTEIDAWFQNRDLAAAQQASLLTNGSVVSMAGRLYQVDSSATGTASITHDLGVDGLVAFGVAHPEQHGSLTRTMAITLDDGDKVEGNTSRDTVITNQSATSVFDLPGNAGTSKDIGINLSSLTVKTDDYALGSGVGLDSHNQGYPLLWDVELRGGLTAAARLRSTVGLTAFSTIFGYSKYAMLMDNESGGVEGNTFTRMFAPAFRIADSGIHNINVGRGVQLFSPLFEGLSALVTSEDTDSNINNFVTYGGWCEATVGGKVAYDATGSNYDVGPQTMERRLEGCNVPVLHGMYWAGHNVHKGSFYPKHYDHHLTPSGTKGVALFREQETDKQFDWSGTVSNWGEFANYALLATMPKLGEIATPDEKYGRQQVFNSIGVASHAGIWDGSSGPVTNLFDTGPSQTGYIAPAGTVYWPYGVNAGGTVAMTTGQADPYGGTDGILIEDGRRGCTNIPEFLGGDKWMTVVLIAKAKAAGDVLQIVINSTGGAETQSKTLEMEMPDTEWRIYHAHIFLRPNAGANYRVGIGATRIDHTTDYTSVDYVSGGGVTIARAACFEGADLHPVLNYGQEVTTGFRFVQGNVEVLGTAAPTTGKWFVGDRVQYKAPTAGGKMGAVCVTAGSPGTWKEFGAIDA